MFRIDPVWRIATALLGAAAMVASLTASAVAIGGSTPDKEICDVAADTALGLEDYPKAIRLHRDVLRSNPKDSLAHYHLGFAYAMVGRRADELNEYRTAAALGLEQWDLYLNLGLAYFDQSDFGDAATSLEHAALLGPKHEEAHYNLALAYEAEHRLPEALQQITLSRKLAPDDLNAGNTNAIICAETGDMACARDIWTQLLQESPDYQVARVNLTLLNSSREKVAGPQGRALKLADGR